MLGGYTYRNMFSKSKSFTLSKISSKTGSKSKRTKRSKRPKRTRRTKKIGLLNF
jgi:hypothetical protein